MAPAPVATPAEMGATTPAPATTDDASTSAADILAMIRQRKEN
jgi:hypothetical protein